MLLKSSIATIHNVNCCVCISSSTQMGWPKAILLTFKNTSSNVLTSLLLSIFADIGGGVTCRVTCGEIPPHLGLV